MFGRQKPEVLVVGAGPVGLCAALALAKKGIRVTIVDKEWRTGAHSYALALHSRSLELLEPLGLKEPLLRKADPVQTIGLYDSDARRAEMRITDNDQASPPLAVMRQDVLEHELEAALQHAGVKVLWNHAVSRLECHEGHVVATIDKMVKESVGYAIARSEWMVAKSYDLEVPFVIGADGHHSLVRRALDIDFADLGGTQHFAVFEFVTDADLGHEMRIMLGEHSTDVLWPLPDKHCRWSFQLLDTAAPEATRTKNRLPAEIGSARFPLLDEEFLRHMIAERATWFRGRIDQINWRIMVRFERRLAKSFGQNRVWLAGDAGHLTGPAGMHSMNVGLREALDLAAILDGVLRQGNSTETLQDYNRQRIAEWRSLLGLGDGLMPQDQADSWVRRCSDRLLPCIPASGADLDALLRQIRLSLP